MSSSRKYFDSMRGHASRSTWPACTRQRLFAIAQTRSFARSNRSKASGRFQSNQGHGGCLCFSVARSPDVPSTLGEVDPSCALPPPVHGQLSPHGIKLAQWLAAEEWTWIVEKAGGIRKAAMLSQVVSQLIELNRAILSLIESGIVRHGELHEEILRVLTTCARAYPVRALVELLETAHDRSPATGCRAWA
jgi:hypothetical protein